jgi:hypothetical protein
LGGINCHKLGVPAFAVSHDFPQSMFNAAQPTPRIERVIINEGAHIVTASYQLFGEMRSNEAIRSSDKDFVHSSSVSNIQM